MEEPTKSLSEWRVELKRYGKKHWLNFYRSLLDQPVSSPPRLYKSLNLYGEWPLFEAIIAASTSSTLTGDKLNYVLKICSNKWKEMQEDADAESEYTQEIERIKEASHKQNEEMARKLKKVKGHE